MHEKKKKKNSCWFNAMIDDAVADVIAEIDGIVQDFNLKLDC